jgi:hypothetical protein
LENLQLGDGEVGGIVHSVPGGPPVPPADPQDAVCKRGHFFEMLMRVVLQRCPQVLHLNPNSKSLIIISILYVLFSAGCAVEHTRRCGRYSDSTLFDSELAATV